MAVLTIVPFFGLLFARLQTSYRYATFMSSWSATTLLWVFWLLERIATWEYFVCLGITCFFPVFWFYRTKIRPPKC
jgi:hypothetical protein